MKLSLPFATSTPSLSLILAVALTGCAAETGDAPADVGEVPASHEVVGEFVLHLSPRNHQATLTRVSTGAAHGGAPGLTPESENTANLCQDGVSGSNDPTKCGLAAGTPTVELSTDAASVNTDAGCPSGFQSNSFCASVTLDSFWSRALPFAYAQVTSITDDTGKPLSGHSGINSDATAYGLSNSLGLWAYNSADASSAFLGQAPDNSAAREWVFANPDDADTNVQIRVMAATTFSTYLGFQTLSHPYINACNGGLQVRTSITHITAAVPFPFTVYGTTYDGTANPQSISFSEVGVVTFGSTTDTTSGANIALPSSSAPSPAVFAFWDDIAYNGTGMCYLSGGTAPNRYFAISWSKMNFSASAPASDKPASMTFGAVLHEGSDQIDLAYSSMTGPSTRSKGAWPPSASRTRRAAWRRRRTTRPRTPPAP